MKKGNINSEHRWDEAIADARRKLMEAKVYLARIKAALKILERKKGVGEPWPGESATPATPLQKQAKGHRSEQQHAI
jgi:hypothetical protein